MDGPSFIACVMACVSRKKLRPKVVMVGAGPYRSSFKSTVIERAKSAEGQRGQLGTKANVGRRGTIHILRCAFLN